MVHPSSPLQASLEVVRNLDFPFGFLYMWSWSWNYLVKQGRKLANSLFTQTFQNFANFPKLIREMPLFWNSIFGQSSYSEPKNLKKKKIETWVPRKKFKWSSNTSHGTRVSKKKKILWFHVRYNLMFQKSSFTFGTQFLENRVSKQGHFPN